MHRERDAARAGEIIRLIENLAEERQERIRLQAEVAKEREERVRLQLDNAATKQQLQDLIKKVELWDNRRWSLFILLISTVFTLASGLIVLLVKK